MDTALCGVRLSDPMLPLHTQRPPYLHSAVRGICLCLLCAAALLLAHSGAALPFINHAVPLRGPLLPSSRSLSRLRIPSLARPAVQRLPPGASAGPSTALHSTPNDDADANGPAYGRDSAPSAANLVSLHSGPRQPADAALNGRVGPDGWATRFLSLFGAAAAGLMASFGYRAARSLGSAGEGSLPVQDTPAGVSQGGRLPATPANPHFRPLVPKTEPPRGALREVPRHIERPAYVATGVPRHTKPYLPWQVEEKSAADVERMRRAGRVAREVLDAAVRQVRPGVTTYELDGVVHAECIARGAYPSPLNYNYYPRSVSTSINEVVTHGIPCEDTVLEEGDIVNIDVTVYYDGMHGDCSEMIFVGKVDDEARRLVQTTYDAWQKAIAYCKPGRKYQDIGGIIEDHIEKEGYSSCREFVGHGIGKIFHTTPSVKHYRNDVNVGIMRPGHTFTIEPMICEGSAKSVLWPDGWTAVTEDGRRSAQFEHTLLITEDGVEVLTGKLPTSPVQPWEKPVDAAA